MTKTKEQYQELVKSFKKLQADRASYLEELAEKKGNKAAFEREKEAFIAELKELNVEPQNLVQEIDSRTKKISEKMKTNKEICEKLEANKIG